MRALHKLKEILSCPSDSMLFFWDVERKIEQGTAAKLEGFIVMKTISIHTSVKKWDDRAKSGTKSIVGCFRKGIKKNREIIEKAEKKQRDHFQHKAHKKPEKKTILRRDSTVYSTMRQTSLCGFISLKNNLY